MNLDNEADQVNESAVEGSAVEQSQDKAGAQPNQASEAVTLSEFAVGNQDFKTLDALKKAYAESQKGYTQKTQEWAKKEKSYKYLHEALAPYRNDKAKWDRLMAFLDKGESALGASQQPAPAAQPATLPPEFLKRMESQEDRLSRYEAENELSSFRQSHPDLAEEEVRLVIEQVIKWDDQGKDRTLEEAYRWLLPEKIGAKQAAVAEQKAKADAERKKSAASLGSTPTGAQSGVRNADNLSVNQKLPAKKSENQKNAMIDKLLKEMGAKFDD